MGEWALATSPLDTSSIITGSSPIQCNGAIFNITQFFYTGQFHTNIKCNKNNSKKSQNCHQASVWGQNHILNGKGFKRISILSKFESSKPVRDQQILAQLVLQTLFLDTSVRCRA